MIQSNVFCKGCGSHLVCDVGYPVEGDERAVRVFLYCENEECDIVNGIQHDREIYFDAFNALV